MAFPRRCVGRKDTFFIFPEAALISCLFSLSGSFGVGWHPKETRRYPGNFHIGDASSSITQRGEQVMLCGTAESSAKDDESIPLARALINSNIPMRLVISLPIGSCLLFLCLTSEL